MTIDWWTLAIQTVNVVILIWLLQRFFWQPVAAMIEQRRTTTQNTLAEAQAKRTEAATALAEIERTRAGIASERDAILKAAQETAEQMQASRLDEAKKAVASMEATAKLAIAKEYDAADKAWEARSGFLAMDIAKRLASRLDGPVVQAAFLDWLLREIRRLPDATRQAVAATGKPLEAISATPLEAPEQERYREKIGQAFGVPSQVSFKVDPALIAGIELHGAHLLVSNSWRADLAQIMADIAHADKH
jgi:F-type H+-transporting ATPase subunit b